MSDATLGATALHAAEGVSQSVQGHELAGEHPDACGGVIVCGVSERRVGGTAAAVAAGSGRRRRVRCVEMGEAHRLRLDEVLLERVGDRLRVRLHQRDEVGERVDHAAAADAAAGAKPTVEGVQRDSTRAAGHAVGQAISIGVGLRQQASGRRVIWQQACTHRSQAGQRTEGESGGKAGGVQAYRCL